MTHLDLFSGIGGFSLGLKRVFDIKHTFFSEIDKYAIDVYKHNFKNSTYVKSVTDVRGGELPRIDIITFGSPCQDFSLAGKRKGMDGERSSLITEAIRLIKECKPSFFIWENVKGTFSSNSGEDFWAIIKAFTNIGGYRLEWQLLNTKWFLPQNRERIYLVGCLGKGSGQQIFPITENNRQIDETRANPNTCTLTTRYKASTSQGSYIAECNKVSQEEIVVGDFRNDEGFRPRKDGDSPCLATRKHSETDVSTMPPILKIKTNNKKGYEIAEPRDTINYQKHNYVIGYSRDAKGKVTSYHTKDIANTLHSSSGGGGNTDQYILNKNIRRLTPKECERLQGFPDNWTKYGQELGEISDSQRYKMCGNAVTVDVVEAVAKNIKKVL